MIDAIIKQYFNPSKVESIEPYGNGHINNTFLITFPEKKYILQEINKTVFNNPARVMKNIEAVTRHLKKKAIYEGKNPNRAVLNVVYTLDNKEIVCYKEHYYRCYEYIEDATTYEQVENNEMFYEMGKVVGEFQKLLMDFDSSVLSAPIKNFHNTPKRFETFLKICKKDAYKRAQSCENEIDFVLNREEKMSVITELLDYNLIPLRVTHNDTKLNNIMFDSKTKKALCLIDLDTVMPGSILYDYGDGLRLGASTALEDEENLDLVDVNLELFEAYTRGFLEEAKEILNQYEIDNLLNGYYILTLECGMRFLTDYLNNDQYFKISKKDHNLIRAKNQFKLVLEIENKEKELKNIINKILN